MDHAMISCSLFLDPGPEYPHYLLDDSDFNVFEEPTSAIYHLDGPGGKTENWLHKILEYSCLGLEQLPMVRRVYVDFDLGTGLAVPERPNGQETTF